MCNISLDYAIDKFEDNNVLSQVTNYGRVTAWEENYESSLLLKQTIILG